MKIIIYCRVSKSNYGGSGSKFGIDTNSNIQIDECMNYCKEQGWKDNNITIYNEERISRKGGNIPGLRNILDEMKSGDVIVIYTVDRLSRNTLEGIKFLEDLNAKGCRIISVIEKATYDKEDIYGRFKFRDRINHAELESDRASQRITRSLNNKRTSIKTKTISSTRFQCKQRKKQKRKRSKTKTNDQPKAKKIKHEPVVTITTNTKINRNYFLRNTLEKYESNNSNSDSNS